MAKYKIVKNPKVNKELKKHLKSGDKTTIKRIEKIFKELEVHPTEGVGNPEQLKYQFSGFWSRRLNSKDRLVYSINEDEVIVFIISAMGHY